MADLCICLGTSLQIQPINLVPFNAKKNKGRVVICNLQKTKVVSNLLHLLVFLYYKHLK